MAWIGEFRNSLPNREPPLGAPCGSGSQPRLKARAVRPIRCTHGSMPIVVPMGGPWPIDYTRRRERCAGRLFPRCDNRERLRGPLVRGAKVEIVDGVYRVRNDEPTPRIGSGLHRTL